MALAPPPSLDLVARRIEYKLSHHLHALLSQHNVIVSRQVIAAIMPDIRVHIDEAMAADADARDSSSRALRDEQEQEHQERQQDLHTPLLQPQPILPEWFTSLPPPPRSLPLLLPEWCDPSYRVSNGWSGNDYVHAISSPARIIAYTLLPPSSASASSSSSSSSSAATASSFPSLIGVAHFTSSCESHRRFCHGNPPPTLPQTKRIFRFNYLQQAVQRARSLTTPSAGWDSATPVPWSRGRASLRR